MPFVAEHRAHESRCAFVRFLRARHLDNRRKRRRGETSCVGLLCQFKIRSNFSAKVHNSVVFGWVCLDQPGCDIVDHERVVRLRNATRKPVISNEFDLRQTSLGCQNRSITRTDPRWIHGIPNMGVRSDAACDTARVAFVVPIIRGSSNLNVWVRGRFFDVAPRIRLSRTIQRAFNRKSLPCPASPS